MKKAYFAILFLTLLPPALSLLVLGAADGVGEEQAASTDVLFTIFRTFGPAGTVGVVLLFGVRWLANRLEASQATLITILTGVIKDNTVALQDVKNAVSRCPGNLGQPHNK